MRNRIAVLVTWAHSHRKFTTERKDPMSLAELRARWLAPVWAKPLKKTHLHKTQLHNTSTFITTHHNITRLITSFVRHLSIVIGRHQNAEQDETVLVFPWNKQRSNSILSVCNVLMNGCHVNDATCPWASGLTTGGTCNLLVHSLLLLVPWLGKKLQVLKARDYRYLQ